MKRSENKEFKVKVLSLQYCLHNFCNLLRYCLGDFDERGIYGMRQKLLKNALNKKMRSKRDHEKNIEFLETRIRGKLNNIHRYLVTKSLQSNVVKHEKQILKTQTKVAELKKEYTSLPHFNGNY